MNCTTSGEKPLLLRDDADIFSEIMSMTNNGLSLDTEHFDFFKTYTQSCSLAMILNRYDLKELDRVERFLFSPTLKLFNPDPQEIKIFNAFVEKAKIDYILVKAHALNNNTQDILNKMQTEHEEVFKKIEMQQNKIKDSLEKQKLDFLAMMTLVFSAFTILSVNASLLAGIAKIDVLTWQQALGIFIAGNVTVLLGLFSILCAVDKITGRDLYCKKTSK